MHESRSRSICRVILPRLGVALVPILLAVLACSAPNILVAIPSTPIPTSTPRVIVLVATPTVGPIVDSADAVEARRIAVYQRTAPAVVNITTQVLHTSFFWGTVPEEGSGSGFLWDREGHIVTNYHVVEGAQRIEVTFGGDKALPATIVGTDPLNDLAVLQVDVIPAGIQPLEVGTSASLQVGQTAIAIGNPFG
jgi:S1-C subfamily serine protease